MAKDTHPEAAAEPDPTNVESRPVLEPDNQHGVDNSDSGDNSSSHSIEVRQTPEFLDWLRRLKDRTAQQRIAKRLVRVQGGLLGDVKFFDGIGEIKIDHGPGYRLYFVKQGNVVIVLLCGGDKDSQKRDIARALELAKEV